MDRSASNKGMNPDRRLYDDVFDRALRYALPHVPRDQGLDIAHEVATAIVRRSVVGAATTSPDTPTNTFVYRAVIHRLIDHRRAATRRGVAQRVHLDEGGANASAWANPAEALDASELAQLLQTTIAAMPPAMRRVFLLVRDDELSYREAAERLGVGVGTIHTQLSRAAALLRRAIERYRAADAPANDPLAVRTHT